MVVMEYTFSPIADSEIPAPRNPLLGHALEIYAGETNKVASVWREFGPEDLSFRPHTRSSSVAEIMRHQLLSERRFFGEFLGSPEPPAAETLPAESSPDSFISRLV